MGEEQGITPEQIIVLLPVALAIVWLVWKLGAGVLRTIGWVLSGIWRWLSAARPQLATAVPTRSARPTLGSGPRRTRPAQLPPAVEAEELQTRSTRLVPAAELAPLLAPLPEAPKDPRTRTIEAIALLPPAVRLHRQHEGEIPVLFDGVEWHFVDVLKFVHWGVFGTTGSGKGNTLQHIALAALSLGPEKVRLVVLDGKGGVDYGFCRRIAHAQLAIRKEIDQVAGELVAELVRRTELLAAVDARNVEEYHQRAPEAPRIPALVVIADELINFSKEARACLDEIACTGRAAGMNLFVAAQHPTTEVISSQLQANLANRLVFRVASSEYTRVALKRFKGEGTYEPAAIREDAPGVAVLRANGGAEVVGRTPHITDDIRDRWIATLAKRWPAVQALEAETPPSDMTGFDAPSSSATAAPAAQAETPPAPTTPSTSAPVWSERHIKVAALLALDPNMSNRAIGRVLFPGSDGGGKHSQKVSKIREELGSLVSETVAAVTPVTPVTPAEEHAQSEVAEEGNGVTVTPAEDPPPGEISDTALAA